MYEAHPSALPSGFDAALAPLVEVAPGVFRPFRLVILESPYAGNVERNVAYARAALGDSLRRGEAPIASHLLYTQAGVLDDLIPAERRLGIEAGLAWNAVAQAAVFYVDLGWSNGMLAARERHLARFGIIEERTLEGWGQ